MSIETKERFPETGRVFAREVVEGVAKLLEGVEIQLVDGRWDISAILDRRECYLALVELARATPAQYRVFLRKPELTRAQILMQQLINRLDQQTRNPEGSLISLMSPTADLDAPAFVERQHKRYNAWLASKSAKEWRLWASDIIRSYNSDTPEHAELAQELIQLAQTVNVSWERVVEVATKCLTPDDARLSRSGDALGLRAECAAKRELLLGMPVVPHPVLYFAWFMPLLNTADTCDSIRDFVSGRMAHARLLEQRHQLDQVSASIPAIPEIPT